MRACVLLLLLAACTATPPATPPDAGPSALAYLDDPPGDPPAVAFAAGPYGINPYDLAGPFTLPQDDGTTFDFAASWTGTGSLVALFGTGFNPTARDLWNGPLKPLLARLPPDTHVLFASLDVTAEDDVRDLRFRLNQALASLPGDVAEHWRTHVHLVPKQATKLDGWVGELARTRPGAGFGIDRTQHVREIGLLSNVGRGNIASLEFLASEAVHYDFEARRDYKLTNRPARLVPVFEDFATPAWSSGFVEADLPSAAELAPYDTLEFDVTHGCPGHLDANCQEWDQGMDVFLCDEAAPDSCDTLLGRWITSYHREGRWVMDASSLLPLVQGGGHRRFRVFCGATVRLGFTLRFSTRNKPQKPAGIVHLPFKGGAFDAHYNDGRVPYAFEVPAGTHKVELVGIITGHGFGADTENCAEFCNHEHHFTLNGTEFVKSHPMAGSDLGCLEQVADGVLPNQYGTWPFGRGGWCPGYEVKPWVVDLTARLAAGTNTLDYRGLFHGETFVPKPVPNSSNFGGQISLDAYLVFWK